MTRLDLIMGTLLVIAGSALDSVSNIPTYVACACLAYFGLKVWRACRA